MRCARLSLLAREHQEVRGAAKSSLCQQHRAAFLWPPLAHAGEPLEAGRLACASSPLFAASG
eukprot:10988458-Alexandrium_andersonii.AAC.1